MDEGHAVPCSTARQPYNIQMFTHRRLKTGMSGNSNQSEEPRALARKGAWTRGRQSLVDAFIAVYTPSFFDSSIRGGSGRECVPGTGHLLAIVMTKGVMCVRPHAQKACFAHSQPQARDVPQENSKVRLWVRWCASPRLLNSQVAHWHCRCQVGSRSCYLQLFGCPAGAACAGTPRARVAKRRCSTEPPSLSIRACNPRP